MKYKSRTVFYIAIALMVLLFLSGYFFFGEFFTLEHIQANTRFFKQFVMQHYVISVLIYVTVFGLLLACGMPVGIPFALIGGFLYTTLPGIMYAELACLMGSLISFTVLRYVVFHWIKDWHDPRVESFNKQIHTYGYSYLLMLNFLSIVPMFVINFLAAMAKIPLRTIVWVTIVGCFPLNLLCVIAGQKLSSIHSFSDIFSPSMICLMIIVMLVISAPLFLKKIKGFFGV